MLNRARRILWLVTGEDKVDALAQPARRRSIHPGRAGGHDRTRSSSPTRLRQDLRHERRPDPTKYPVEPRAPAILTVDVGGSHVKEVLNGIDERRRFTSGHKLTPQQMVDGVLEQTAGLGLRGVSIGYPAPVVGGQVAKEPVNLGPGWVGFDFAAAFGKPAKVINDAAMQALGSYEGGRMLFLGLGTGLGSALIVDGVIAPMELGHLPVPRRRRSRTTSARPRRSATVTSTGRRRLRDDRPAVRGRSYPTTSCSAGATPRS